MERSKGVRGRVSAGDGARQAQIWADGLKEGKSA